MFMKIFIQPAVNNDEDNNGNNKNNNNKFENRNNNEQWQGYRDYDNYIQPRYTQRY